MATSDEVVCSPQSAPDDVILPRSVVLADSDSEDESSLPAAISTQDGSEICRTGETQMMVRNVSAPLNVGGKHVTNHVHKQRTFVENQHIYYMCEEQGEANDETPPAGGSAPMMGSTSGRIASLFGISGSVSRSSCDPQQNGKHASLLAVYALSAAVLAALVVLGFGGGAASSAAAGLVSAGFTMGLAVVAAGGAGGAVLGCFLAKLIATEADDAAVAETKPKEQAEKLIVHQDVAVAAASTVTTGISLAGTSAYALLDDGYCVTCVLEVENWLGVCLISPYVQLSGGVVTMPPSSSIVPASREAMVARKYSGTATGSYGTVSWLIQGFNRRLVIMWSAPYNFNHYMNWLAVGLTAPGVTEPAADDVWFNQMYYYSDDKELRFKRQEFYYNVRPVFFRDADLEVEGIMANAHKAMAKVILRPVNKDSLATGIKKNMVTCSSSETTPVVEAP